jgi:hypothetical protein
MGGKNAKHQIQLEPAGTIDSCRNVCCLFPFTSYKRFFLSGMSGYNILPFLLPFNDMKLLALTDQQQFKIESGCEFCNPLVDNSCW